MDINDSESIDDIDNNSIGSSSSGGSSNVSDLISTDSDDDDSNKLKASGTPKSRSKLMNEFKILNKRLILPKTRLLRAIRSILHNLDATQAEADFTNCRLKKESIEALHYTLEDHLIDYLQKSKEVTLMSNRKTTMGRDFELVRTISQKDYKSRHPYPFYEKKIK